MEEVSELDKFDGDLDEVMGDEEDADPALGTTDDKAGARVPPPWNQQ